jgi:hypothetical protein
MLMESSEANSLISTLGVPSEPDPTPAERDLLKVLIGAESVETHRSAASGPLCVIRLRSSDEPDRSCLKSDWVGNWFRRPCESVTILHDPTDITYTQLESPSPHGTNHGSRHVTFLGLSDVIAISLHPTDDSKRVVDPFEASVFLLRANHDCNSLATMIAINRDGGLVHPEEGEVNPHWFPINSLRTGTFGSRTFKTFR